MMESTINKLKNVIAAKQFVNCFAREFSLEDEDKGGLDRFLSKLKEKYNNLYVDIDIQGFAKCENEEQEASVLLDLINRELTAKDLIKVQIQAISITHALHQWSTSLDRRALLVFHYFHELYNEKEKNILRSLRKALSNRNELSSYLGLLIASDKKISKWELLPYSNLDERHVVFFEC